MSQWKSIIFTALFCLLFCTTELYALDSNELNPEKQKKTFSLGGIVKSLGGTVNGIGKSVGGTVNGLEKSLGGVVGGLGKSLDGTANGIGKTIGGTFESVGDFLEENGEVFVVAGITVLFIIAETNYHHGHHYGHHYYGH